MSGTELRLSILADKCKMDKTLTINKEDMLLLYYDLTNALSAIRLLEELTESMEYQKKKVSNLMYEYTTNPSRIYEPLIRGDDNG